MGLTRKDLEDPNLKPEDRRDYEILIARYLECDKWAKRALQPIGVLITSHPGNRAYLKASLETHKKLGYWTTLVYDNYFADGDNVDYNVYLPPRDIMDIVDTFIMPHHQTWGGVLYPYFWLLKFGLSVMTQNFEYVYCANGDCIIENPENFPKIIEMLGDADILGCGWETEPDCFNTTSFIAKSSAIHKLMKHFEEHFIPLDNYEKYTQEIGNCESRFAVAIKELGLKQVIVPENPYNTQLHKKGGTWYDILGFRHIHAEHAFCYRYHSYDIPEIKYLDSRFMGGEYNTIKEYWELKKDGKEEEAKKLLEGWWCKA